MWTSTFMLLGVTILPYTYSSWDVNPERLSCDFENDLCHYAPRWLWQDEGWKTQKAGSAGMGPTKDHANSESGHYVIGRGHQIINGYPKQWRRLRQSDINVTTDSCLTFWYFLSDVKHSNFKVMLLEHPFDPATEFMTKDSKPEKTWTKAYVDLETKLYTEVVILGTLQARGYRITKYYFAFDDIKFEKTPCQSLCQADADAEQP